MARLNTSQREVVHTHEGAKTFKQSPEKELRRAVLSCMLWEDTFYESGEDIGSRIQSLAAQCKPEFVAALTDEARNVFKIRHASLWLAMGLLKNGGKATEEALYNAIQRPDEITESLAMYWKANPRGASAKVPRAWMKAVSRCFLEKFDEYQLSKYNRQGDVITLRDAYFLAHPMANASKLGLKVSDDKAALFKRLVDGNLKVAETWENKLSAGKGKTTSKSKKESFESLLKRNKIGGMAVLRNLRNMRDNNVPKELVREKLVGGASKNPSLPFRYIAASAMVPQWEDIIDEAMLASFKGNDSLPKLTGTTAVAVDVSGSMSYELSEKSTMRRIDAACGLAIFAREASDDCRVFQFGTTCREVAPRRGMALRDAIFRNQVGHGTNIGLAVGMIQRVMKYDRIIVITDMQSSDQVPAPAGKGYIINTAPYKNSIGYGAYTLIDGWSDQVVRFIQETEQA